MMCPCGGNVRTTTTTLKTRKSLFEWFPDGDCQPPTDLVVSRCLACGRLDKRLKEIKETKAAPAGTAEGGRQPGRQQQNTTSSDE